MSTAPLPDLKQVLNDIGEAGARLCEIEAGEGAAGNISACLRWPVDLPDAFPHVEPFALPQPAPQLAGATIVVTGSGRRLRELRDDPRAGLGCVLIDQAGSSATLHTADTRRFERITSEFNSHLAVHIDHVARTGARFHALVHAQPLRLTYLSHVPAYRDTLGLNTRLLRWQPELIIQFPEGIGFLPFSVPGSDDLMDASVHSLRRHRVIVWAKHGVLARSDHSAKQAVDLIDYAETAAKYEYLDLASGGHGEGLTCAEIRAVCAAFGVEQQLFTS